MPTTLTENEYIWTISFESRDDGFRVDGPSFTDKSEAEKHLKKYQNALKPKVYQRSLWFDSSSGKYYKVTIEDVSVDMEVIREAAMAKLTKEEKAALGLV